MREGGNADKDVDAAFVTLAASNRVLFGGFGFTGEITDVTLAYRTVRATGNAHRGRIQWLLEHATPAGKVYAATLLSEIDPAAGKKAWERLTEETGSFQTGGGCVIRQVSVAQYARDELHKNAQPPNQAAPPTLIGPPSVDSDATRRAIKEALLGRPRVILTSARDESHFVQALFGSAVAAGRVYVSRETTDQRGPRFDLYQSVVDPAYPFHAVFNVSGAATVESTELDPELAAYFFKHYPGPTEKADKARRLVSALALQQPGWRAESQHLGDGVGMVIPQRAGALPVVHEIRPAEAVFHKFIVPRRDRGAVAAATGQGFEQWQAGTDTAGVTAVVSVRH